MLMTCCLITAWTVYKEQVVMENDSSDEHGGIEEGLDVTIGLEDIKTHRVDDQDSGTSSEGDYSSDLINSGDDILELGPLNKLHAGHIMTEASKHKADVLRGGESEGLLSVGGSATSKHGQLPIVSGDNALQLVKNFVEKGSGSTYEKHVDTLKDSDDIVREVHVHLSQTNVHKPRAITFGGKVVVDSPKPDDQTTEDIPIKRTRLHKLRDETSRRMQKWTKGMIHTVVTQTVLGKISSGSSWITITGCPGEGKTTTGYLVLKTLNDMGRPVFDISRPEDYFIAKGAKKPILMFNDIFGSSVYDLDKRWKEVLNDVLSIKEHTREEETKDFETRNQMTVILISRANVLKEASSRLGRFKDFLLGEKCLVDLTNGVQTVAEERRKIWNYHADKHSIKVDEQTVAKICDGTLPLPHGFPHCCSLFASMFVKNSNCDMKTFFCNPLEFLNKSMHDLMADKESGPLLRDILKSEGSICLDDILDDEKRYQYWSILEKLDGTYLSEENGVVQFIHPSIYDSAAFLVCRKDPLFVIRNCSLSFLKERVVIDGVSYGNELKSMHDIVTVNKRYQTHLLERYVSEFKNRNLSKVLAQDVFHDETFALNFVKRVLDQLDDKNVLPEDQKLRLLMSSTDRVSNKTFIYLSTKSKSKVILKYICERVELSSQELNDAFFGVCEHVSIPSMEFLSKRYNLNMEIENANLETPILLAAAQSSDTLLKLILGEKVDINKSDKNSNSVLHKVCRYGGTSDIVEELLMKGVDANKECCEYPYLPLNIACYEGHFDVVKALLDHGVDVNKTNSHGSYPLNEASWMGRIDIVRLLLDRGASVDKVNREGISFLHDASRQGHIEIVTELLKRGADINMATRKGVTPLHDASWTGHMDIVSVLLHNGAVVDKENYDEYDCKTPLHDACSQRHIGVVNLLLDKGASVNHVAKKGDTPLHEAARNGNIELIELLLGKGADINCTNDNGVTPLHESCWNGHNKAVEILIDKGANVDAKNCSRSLNRTPLLDACYRGHTSIVKMLLDKGVDINVADAEGNKAVDIARDCRHNETVRFLESRN